MCSLSAPLNSAQKKYMGWSQSNEKEISLFAKKWCFKKNISDFVSGEVWT